MSETVGEIEVRRSCDCKDVSSGAKDSIAELDLRLTRKLERGEFGGWRRSGGFLDRLQQSRVSWL